MEIRATAGIPGKSLDGFEATCPLCGMRLTNTLESSLLLDVVKHDRWHEDQNHPVEKFFYDHAGWGYTPGEETAEEGRRRGARALAAAEQWARRENVTFAWEPDWMVGSHVEEYDTYKQEPETCESCIAYSPADEVLGSLGCIDDADANYRRVIEAELALDAMNAERSVGR